MEIIIKTITDDNLKPTNSDKAIQEAVEAYIGDLRKKYTANLEEEPTYDATLANGDKVIVHQIEKGPSSFYGRNLFWCSYMADDSTIVTVASSENKREFDEVLNTLEIGEMQEA